MGFNGGLLRCVMGLLAWQVAQPFTYCRTNSLHPGHQYCLSSALCVLSIPGCPAVGESCINSTRSLRSLSSGGTTKVIALRERPSISTRKVCSCFHFCM